MIEGAQSKRNVSNYDHRLNIEDQFATRRDFLTRCGMGMGAVAFADLLGGQARASNAMSAKASPGGGKAKHVIHLFMNGGPSHVDTFDPKPALAKHDGKELPMPMLRTERRTGAAMASPFAFKKYGQSGIEVSDLFPQGAESIDDLCVVRSMHADVPNHEPGLLLMHSGNIQPVRPSMGSWMSYGLGSENKNLPSFVCLCPGLPVVGPQLWSN